MEKPVKKKTAFYNVRFSRLRAYSDPGDIFGSKTPSTEAGTLSARQQKNILSVTYLAMPRVVTKCLHSRSGQPGIIKIAVFLARFCGKGFRMHYSSKNPVRKVLSLLFSDEKTKEVK